MGWHNRGKAGLERIIDMASKSAITREMKKSIGTKLFQEIDSTQADIIVTGCAACKLQIEAGTGARAIHPVILLQEAYGLGIIRNTGG